MRHDVLIVGAGLWGAAFARQLLDAGRTVLVLDKRDHIGGNCHTATQDGIQVHKYGPHVFHTRSRRIWDYASQFADFNHFRLHGRTTTQRRVYSMPPGLTLFNQLWGVTTPAEARDVLEGDRIPRKCPANLEEFLLDAVGTQIYDGFYRDYSRKQWGRDPSRISVAVGRRLPIRMTWDDRWFDDAYEGIPIGGYTAMIGRMLDGAAVELGVDFLADRERWLGHAKCVAYTGRLDAFFDYDLGELEYRSLRFEDERLEGDYQGVAIMHYPDIEVPYTRIVEHKHFEFGRQPHTLITRSYPMACTRQDVPYYPVDTPESRALYRQYRRRFDALPGFVGGGRLFAHRYLDMDAVIASALATADAYLGRSASLV